MNKPKQLLTRLKNKPQPSSQIQTNPSRVTSDTISKHREELFSRARKFKYPFYRSKHRVALTSALVVVVALALLGLLTSLRLYVQKDTGEFTYRVTQIIPFPVAKVDGSYAKYESYLFQFRYIVYWLEQYGYTDLRSPDGQRQIERYKRLSLDKALESSIAQKFAKEKGITVSKQEVDEVIQRINSKGGDLRTILREQFNLTENEYRRLTTDEILKAKVAKELDQDAPKQAEEAFNKIKSGTSFAEVAKQYSDNEETKQLGGELGVIERNRADLPGEVVEAAFRLKKNQTSEVIASQRAYYIVKVLEVVDKNKVRVGLIQINVKDMTAYLKEYRDQGKVKEYIKLEDAE